VKKASLAAVGPIVLVLLAGCGSSSKSTTAASTPARTATEGSPTAATASSTPSPAAVVITTKPSRLGTILAMGPKRLTVYLFEADTAKTASCAGSCASVWPAVTGQPQAGGHALSSKLGRITRPDGITQVTYNGHPLYLYARDKDNGDAYGQGLKSFGAGWYVLKPSGSKVDTS
jgi:predicted lipoprotein with Yx(FWY)xxD motif